MALVLAALSMAMAAPPPLPGDERTEILASVNALVDALASNDHEAVQALLEGEGSMIRHDIRDPRKTDQTVTPFAKLREPNLRDQPVMIERLGIPTLFQRGPIAQVWVPYRFSISGKLSHCGIDAFTVVKRDDRWRVASIVYTVENTDKCKELAAPESDD
ncbi:MAG: hypothetical protein KDE32_01920 [Novosphingobium sp.]|nr:hypothetical protein [Novosphingobium sp.]